MFRIWLDDERPPPPGWRWAKTSPRAIMLIDECVAQGESMRLSLDFDLSASRKIHANAMPVATHLAESVAPDFVYQPVVIHSRKPAGARGMAALLRKAGYEVALRPHWGTTVP